MRRQLEEELARKEQENALLQNALAKAKSDVAATIAQISHSEKRYRDLFNLGQALICTHDVNGVLLSVNPAICSAMGFTEEELIGKEISDFIPSPEKNAFQADYLDVINKNGVVKGVFPIITKSGRKIYLLYQNYKAEEAGTQPYIIGFSQDITDRKKTEGVLRRSEEKYRGIIENMNLGLLETDAEEKIRYANQSFCGICGYTAEELYGKTISSIFAGSEGILRVYEKSLNRGSSMSEAYEVAVRNRKGEPRWLLVSIIPIYDSQNNLSGTTSIHIDITRQKVLEHKLLEAKLEAEESARAKDLFLTNMSHEIRTPMNAITGMGRQLQKTPLNSQQQFFLDTINTASANLLVIIDDILDLSKIESGRLSLQHKAFSLADVLDKAVFIMGQKAKEKSITLAKTIDTTLAPYFKGDMHRLSQVINNLLSNAIKFTEKGQITLSCAVLQDKGNRQVIQVTVKDTGVGMSNDFLKVVFNKFTQEDGGALKYGGTGLGMSISKYLVEAMGGKISVESEKGIGTSVHFIVSLEKCEKSELEDVKTGGISDGILKGLTILLVEDNEMNRIVANTVLGEYGATVSEALNGQEAVNMLRQKMFDVVLMDIRMPVMDGVEATKIIRSEISASVPIIALTANVVKGEKERCISAGMNEFIGKPFDETMLVKSIARLTNRSLVAVDDKANTPVPAKEESLYDLSKLWDISRGKHAFVEKMVNIFITETGNAAKEMREAFEKNDVEKIGSLAHKIKPSLYNLNINSIREDILQLELYGKNGGPAGDIKALVEKVIAVLTAVIEQMKNDPIKNPA